MIIGSGPIVIGQACEFDYSGTQACKALRELGYRIVLANSNPATIMTDPGIADATYIEPLNVARMTEIIAKERPDALLPNLGGQSGLNLCSELHNAGVLKEYGVRIIGVDIDAIQRGEDRILFKETMSDLGIDMPRSAPAYRVEEAEKIAEELGYPVVLRPAYTMGGTGGGLVYNIEELRVVMARGLAASIIHQVLVEESVLGWEELEVEVVRDAKGQSVTVCTIENIDPMGVHTGDSFCVAPFLTVPDELRERLERDAHRIVHSIGVIGGTNVQFAHDPVTDRVVIIEINPRTSRSSALASKATGFPIALISAKLAAGLTLDEIPYWNGKSLAEYRPWGDYVVVKFSRWAFEKFRGAEDKLGTQMRAVGEVMSIGRTYKEAFQKSIRGLENGRYGLGFAKDFNRKTLPELLARLREPSSERQWLLYEALRKGASVEQLFELTKIKHYFLGQMKELVDEEEALLVHRRQSVPDTQLAQAKRNGFADKYLAKILDLPERQIREQRKRSGIVEEWDILPVSGVQGAFYYYSTYNGISPTSPRIAPPPRKARQVMILGGGPNRIGQGIEFDYCCVHAAFALRDAGVSTVMVNCNPETVSTDYDTSDLLYFEPLTVEDVLSIYENEKPDGVIVQFGGQTPLNIAEELAANGVKILGTTPATIAMAEDRDLFRGRMDRMGIPMAESGMATTMDEALDIAARIGYPLMVRPSFVLGGRGMEVVYDEDDLRRWVTAATDVTPERPILIDRFLHPALECEADALCDGTDAFVPAVMEHIEQAGIHSGDSACVIPPVTISAAHLETIEDYTRRIACELNVIGLMNIQYAIADDRVFVLEANPRASRTVPLVSKVCNIPMARLATQLMLGARLVDLKIQRLHVPHFGVKEAVFPFNMFPEVDPLLGPEMRSTGEVLGLADNFEMAFFKAQEAVSLPLPTKGRVLMTVIEKTDEVVKIAREFVKHGMVLCATIGTHRFLADHGVPSDLLQKLGQGRPNLVDAVMNGEVALVINTPAGRASQTDDSYIRKAVIKYRVPYFTTLAAAWAAAQGIGAARKGHIGVRSLQEFHRDLG
jgi:carbamoyl-phosphate synthase large subunit